MQQRPQPSIIFFMIIMAIILAVGAILALSVIQNRPTTPEEATGSQTILVDGIEVAVQLDPENAVQLVDAPVPTQPATEPVATQPQPSPQATPVTVEPLAEATIQPAPTATPVPLQPLPAATAVPQKVLFRDYVVQPNDTLYSIARPIDISIALMAQYEISQEDIIPGNTIRLPYGNPAYCPGYRPYAVGEGDTAFNIARRFNTTANNLRAINNLDANYTVRVADIICVP